MKKLLAILIALPMFAFADVTTSVGYMSDYMWRGTSQSMGAGSLHGGFTVETDSGFYAEAWAGQVDFGDDKASWEYDLDGGYSFSVSDKINLKAGVIQYRYDEKSIDKTEEGYLEVSTKMGSFEYYVDTDNSDKTYMEISLNVPFIKVVDAGFTYGKEDLADTSWKALTFGKSWDKVSLNLMVMEDAKDGQFFDHVSLGFTYSI